MYVVTVKFQVVPEQSDQFESRVLKQAADSLSNEQECLVFDVCRHPSDPAQFFLYEVYVSEDAFKAHLDTPHFKAFDSACANMVASKNVEAFSKLST